MITLQSIDTSLLLFVNKALANNLFDLLMPFLSAQGYLLITPFLGYQLAASAVRRDDQGKRYIIAAVCTIIISFAAVFAADSAEHLLKNAIGRIRPCRSVEGLRMLIRCPHSFSMPSGHAISSFAFAFPLYYLSDKYLSFGLRLFPWFLAAMIAFSRVYLGVHYPSDILVGAFLGIMIGLMLTSLYSWPAVLMEKRRRRKRGIGPFGLPGD